MEFWKGKKVLITGHTGFKGSWLTLWLNKLEAELYGLSLPANDTSLFNVASVSDNIQSFYFDINDRFRVEEVVKSVKPEIIFHLAAQAFVRSSYLDPASTFATNIMGTVHVLSAAEACDSVKATIVITSDKCYENKEWGWGYREIDSLGGYDPYSCSKASAELVVNSYRNSFFKAKDKGIATARAGNVIGGGDWGKDRLIPDLITSFEKDVELVIRNPNAIRPWQHVCEPLGGYLNLGQRLYREPIKYGEAWNFGPSEDANKNVGWIADYVQKEFTASKPWRLSQTVSPHETQVLKLDNSKARANLGWKPTLSVTKTLDWTIAWYKEWLDKKDMKTFTMRQLDSFENLIRC